MYLSKESVKKDAECVFCNGNFLEDKRQFGLSISAVLCGRTWTVQQQRKHSICVTFVNRIEAEMFFP